MAKFETLRITVYYAFFWVHYGFFLGLLRGAHGHITVVFGFVTVLFGFTLTRASTRYGFLRFFLGLLRVVFGFVTGLHWPLAKTKRNTKQELAREARDYRSEAQESLGRRIE